MGESATHQEKCHAPDGSGFHDGFFAGIVVPGWGVAAMMMLPLFVAVSMPPTAEAEQLKNEAKEEEEEEEFEKAAYNPEEG
jgi:hypothetical protein